MESIYQQVIPLNHIHDLRPVAESLCGLMALPSNKDITKEFPRAAGSMDNPDDLARKLAETSERFSEGKREDFVLFVGGVAVGMSQVAVPGFAFFDMDPDDPILAGYVCHPHRGKGLGRLSMQRRLEVVDQRFDGHAVTMVRHGNIASIGLVLSSGFVKTSTNLHTGTYTYGN